MSSSEQSVAIPSKESDQIPDLPFTDVRTLQDVYPFRREDHDWISVVCGHCYDQHEVPVRCGNRFCPTCSQSRTRKVHARLTQLFSKVPKLPYRDFRLITLTIPNSKTAKDGSRALISAFRRLRNRRMWKSKVYGGAFVIEVTQGQNGFHVHIHIVCQALEIGLDQLRREWMAVSNGRIVDIRTMWNINAASYLTKYLTKVKGTADFVIEIGRSLKGVRLYQCFGRWHGIDLKIRLEVKGCERCGNSCWIINIEWRFARTIVDGWDQFDDWRRSKGYLPPLPVVEVYESLQGELAI